jgi:hypothetical protein
MDPSTLYILFGHVALKLHYSKVDTIGGKSTSTCEINLMGKVLA